MKNLLTKKLDAVRDGMNNNKGFSLVELIIVVAIMAVLMGVLAPQYLRFVESSREQKDATALNEVSKAMTTAMAMSEDVAKDDTVVVDVTTGDVDTSGCTGTDFPKQVTATLTENIGKMSSNWASDNGEVTFTVGYYNGSYFVYCDDAVPTGHDQSVAEKLNIADSVSTDTATAGAPVKSYES